MDEFEKKKKEHLNPVLFEAGAGLLDSQSFEYQIAYLLYLFAKLGVEGLTLTKTTAILDDNEKKTAGQLIGLLKKHIDVDSAAEQKLAKALKARNKLVHRFLIDNIERFVDAHERTLLVKEIRELRGQIRASIKSLDPLIILLSKYVENEPVDIYLKEAKGAFMLSFEA
ncbi:conserved protein of unknown function [Pseudoalteromonas translucida]|uniref:Uncharacterized protein n=2 Tax=Pseudoalteromonas translucida TaxID=166935 RepID=Q3IKW1_PSET1|nr:conserved protein of unknown function [Pseudoalteromonas translucida]